MEKVINSLPLIALLLLASTLIFLIVLIPATIVRFQITNIEFIVLSLVVIMSTVASIVALMIFVILSKRMAKKR
jgi:membrane protein implicated in regulation of membrane protease activity